MKEQIADLPEKANHIKVSPITVMQGELLGQHDLDVVVSFLTEDLSWGGPVNQKLIAAVGHQLDEYVLSNVRKPSPGEAFSTPAFNLPFKHLIFAVIPKWDDGFAGEDRHLKNAVKNALQLIQKLGHSKVGIPAIGHGKDDVPLRRGARVISNAIADISIHGFEEIRMLCKTEAALEAYDERFQPG